MMKNINFHFLGFFAICALVIFSLSSSLRNYEQHLILKDQIAKLEYQSLASSSDVIYIPKKVCIMNVDETVDEEKMRKYLGSCLYSHQKWLEINQQEQTE